MNNIINYVCIVYVCIVNADHHQTSFKSVFNGVCDVNQAVADNPGSLHA